MSTIIHEAKLLYPITSHCAGTCWMRRRPRHKKTNNYVYDSRLTAVLT